MAPFLRDTSPVWQLPFYRGTSRSVIYALTALLVLATPGTPLSATHLADQCDLPPRFLTRLLRLLVVRGLITSAPGPHGGYALAEAADQITLLNVVEAIEGPVRLEFDAQDFSPPARSTLSALWHSIEAATRQEFSLVMLAELVPKQLRRRNI